MLSKAGGRSRNEDFANYLMLGDYACWALADGLGGHHGGEVASSVAVEAMLAQFRKEPACSADTLRACLEAANVELRDRQERETALAAMRTTAVLLVTDSRQALWAHLGDSRLYAFRAGRVEFQTKDHSVPQAMCDAGEITPDQVRSHEDRNRLLRALGSDREIRPAVASQPRKVDPGDAFLLCSDGFWGYVTETEMEADLAKAQGPGQWLELMEARLLQHPGEDKDNYSAIAVFIAGDAGKGPQ